MGSFFHWILSSMLVMEYQDTTIAETRYGDASCWTQKPICGGVTRQQAKYTPAGAPCERPAGWGTEHPGIGRCKFHGGATKNATKQAALTEAVNYVLDIMGPAIDVDPMEALIWCVRIAAGEVAYATRRISELEDDEALVNPEEKTHRTGYGPKSESFDEVRSSPLTLHIWIQARHAALDRLARYSKMALDAGIAERQVQLAETAGDEIAHAIRGILDGLLLTAEQERRAPEIVREAMEQLERKASPQAAIEARPKRQPPKVPTRAT